MVNLIKKLKERTKYGIFQDLAIGNDKVQGIVVFALRRIPKGTLLCEYVGNVVHSYSLTPYENLNDLFLMPGPKDSSPTFTINPQLGSNISRYISGINSELPEETKELQINVSRSQKVAKL